MTGLSDRQILRPASGSSGCQRLGEHIRGLASAAAAIHLIEAARARREGAGLAEPSGTPTQKEYVGVAPGLEVESRETQPWRVGSGGDERFGEERG